MKYDHDAVRRMFSEGHSVRAIAAKFGMSRSMVYVVLDLRTSEEHPRNRPSDGRLQPIRNWQLLPAGERFPYPAGRQCDECASALSRYNPGPSCAQCDPHSEYVEKAA